jgi:GAF domain-containing protein
MLADFHRNRADIQQTLQTINDWGLRAVDGTEAGILLMGGRRRRGETVVSTGDRVNEAHALQINMGEGPCLQVLMDGNPTTFVVGDTEGDRRFPQWGPSAASLGLRSSISAVLETEDKRFGSLNVYSSQPHAFTRDDLEVIEVFARRAARAIAVAEESAGLTQALDTRKVIGQAQGVLMERFDLTEERAMEFLMRLSQDRNIKLRDIARWVVEHRDSSLTDVEP